MENIEKEIIQAIKEDRLYDFIANNYTDIDKCQLKDLILELYYMIRYDYVYGLECDEKIMNKYIAKCLKENRNWEG